MEYKYLNKALMGLVISFFFVGIASAIDLVEKDYYIDDKVVDLQVKEFDDDAFHLFTHGKPGKLLIEGEWKNANQILDWLSTNEKLSNKSHLNIYGCEFARGPNGLAAVSYLQSELGVSISASDDITGVDGDWDLEIGVSKEIEGFDSFKGNLQCVDPDMYADNCDFDGDGILNGDDLDDDNDGILDSEECRSGLTGPTNSFGYQDAVLHANHHSAMYFSNDGNLYTWGRDAGIDGGDLREGPVAYGPFPGDLLAFTGGGSQGAVTQFILTTEGLYASGAENQVIADTEFAGDDLAEIDLPTGVTPGDIVDVEATLHGLHILTSDGLVHTKLATSTSNRTYTTYGDGTTARLTTVWKSNNALPDGQKIVQFKANYNAVFGVTDQGRLYAWGRYIYDGDGNGPITSNVPIEITPPAGVTVTQVALTDNFGVSTPPTLTFAVLGTNGRVYTIGSGYYGALGNGTTNASSSTWQSVIDEDGAVVDNAVNISGMSNDDRNTNFSILTDTMGVLSWGYNALSTIGVGNSDASINVASVPMELVEGSITSGNIIAVANGGHITPVFTTTGFCGVGHNAVGALGAYPTDEPMVGNNATSNQYICYDNKPILADPFVDNTCDYDGDGIPNNFDLDSDDDGCSDAFEAGVITDSTSMDFQYDISMSSTWKDDNSNGFNDFLETGEDGVYDGSYMYNVAVDSTVSSICCVQPDVTITGIPTSEICTNDTITLVASATGGAGGDYTYSWEVTSGDMASINGASDMDSVMVSPSMTTEYTLTVEDSEGCPLAMTVTIQTIDAPTIDAGPDVACMAEDFTIGPDSMDTELMYSWSPTTNLSDSTVYNPTVDGNPIEDIEYVLTVKNAAECTSTDTVLVMACTPPTPMIVKTVTDVEEDIDSPGEYLVTYEYEVTVTGDNPLMSVEIWDNLDRQLGDAFIGIETAPMATVDNTSDSTTIMGTDANGSFDGSMDSILYANSGGLLFAGDVLTVEVVARVNIDEGGLLENVATVSGVDPRVPDEPIEVPSEPATIDVPRLEVTKVQTGIPIVQDDGDVELAFEFVVKNTGTTYLEDISLLDDLSSIFDVADPMTDPGAANFEITVTNINADTPPSDNTGTFTGLGANTDLLSGSSVLAPLDSFKVELKFEVSLENYLTIMPTPTNQAVGSGTPTDDMGNELTDSNGDPVDPPMDLSDDPSNPADPDTEDDPTPISIAPLPAVAKTVSAIVPTDSSTHVVTFTYEISNGGGLPFDNIQLEDDFATQFGDAFIGIIEGPMASLSDGADAASELPTVNMDFDGESDVNMLAGDDGNLEIADIITVTVQVEVDPSLADDPSMPLENIATVTGENPNNPGVPITGDSTNPNDTDGDPATELLIPEMTSTKALASEPVLEGNGDATIVFEIVVENTGNTILTDVLVEDDLSHIFPVADPDSLLGMTNFEILVSGDGSPSANTAYDGVADRILNTVGTTLAPGESFTIMLTTRVDAVAFAGLDDRNNSASVSGIPVDDSGEALVNPNTGMPYDSDTAISDIADDATDLDGDGMVDNPNDPETQGDPTPIVIPGELEMTKVVTGEVVLNASHDGNAQVTYELEICNTGGQIISDILILDDLASQFGAGFIEVVDTPSDPTESSAGTSTELGTGSTTFDGSDDTELLSEAATLSPGQCILTQFTIEVDVSLLPEDATNQATVTGKDESGEDVMDLSDSAGMNADEDEPTPFPEAPSLGVSKSVFETKPVDGVPDEFDVVFSFNIKNTGNVVIDNLTLEDKFDEICPFLSVDASTIAIDNISIVDDANVPSANSGFDGTASNPSLIMGGIVAPGEEFNVKVEVRFDASTLDPETGMVCEAPFENQASVGGMTPDDEIVTDMSDNGSTADGPNSDRPGYDDPTMFTLPSQIDAAKQVSLAGGVDNPDVEGNYTLQMDYEICNTGSVDLTNIQFTDDIASLYGDAFIEIVSGSVATGPNRIIGGASGSISGDVPTTNSGFDGSSVTEFFIGTDGLLEPGDCVFAMVQVVVDPSKSPVMGLMNQGVASATGPDDVRLMDETDDEMEVTEPDENDLSVIHLPSISVSKEFTGSELQEDNDIRLSFEFIVQNTGTTYLNDIQLSDLLENFIPAANPTSAFVDLEVIEMAPDSPGENAEYESMMMTILEGGSASGFAGEMLDGSGIFAPGENVTIQLMIDIDPVKLAAIEDAMQTNQASASGTPVDASGAPILDPDTNMALAAVDDLSDSGTDPTTNNPDGEGSTDDNNDDPTPIQIDPIPEVLKEVVTYERLDNLNYGVTYKISLHNLGVDEYCEIQITDDLASQLGCAFVSGEITSTGLENTSGESALPTENASFDGAGAADMFTGTDGCLASGDVIEVELYVELDMSCDGIATPLENTAEAMGVNPKNPDVVLGDISDDSSDLDEDDSMDNPGQDNDTPTQLIIPKLDVYKKLAGIPMQVDENVFRVTYLIEAVNVGNITLQGITLEDDLSEVYAVAASDIALAVSLDPNTASDAPVLNEGYDGDADQVLVMDDGVLEPGESFFVELMFNIDPTLLNDEEVTLNSAIGSAELEDGVEVINPETGTSYTRDDLEDISDDNTDLNGDGMNDFPIAGEDGVDDPTPLYFALLNLVKTSEFLDANMNDKVDVGEFIEFTFVVTNTGLLDIDNIVISDERLGFSEAVGTLSPGESASATTQYAVTQADIDAMGFENEAVANGDADGVAVMDESDSGNPADDMGLSNDPTLTRLYNPELTVLKGSVVDDANSVGDVLVYTVEVINTGNVRIEGITIDDAKLGLMGVVPSPVDALDPGESLTVTFDYVITEEDEQAGFITNTASASGTATDAAGNPLVNDQNELLDPVTDDSDSTNEGDDTGADNDPTMTFLTCPGIACNDNVQISLDANCGGVVARSFLETPYPRGFTLEITKSDGSIVKAFAYDDSSAFVDENGDPFDWSQFVGQEIDYKIITDCDGNSCWGSAKLESNIIPDFSGQPCSNFVMPYELKGEVAPGGEAVVMSADELTKALAVAALTGKDVEIVISGDTLNLPLVGTPTVTGGVEKVAVAVDATYPAGWADVRCDFVVSVNAGGDLIITSQLIDNNTGLAFSGTLVSPDTDFACKYEVDFAGCFECVTWCNGTDDLGDSAQTYDPNTGTVSGTVELLDREEVLKLLSGSCAPEVLHLDSQVIESGDVCGSSKVVNWIAEISIHGKRETVVLFSQGFEVEPIELDSVIMPDHVKLSCDDDSSPEGDAGEPSYLNVHKESDPECVPYDIHYTVVTGIEEQKILINDLWVLVPVVTKETKTVTYCIKDSDDCADLLVFLNSFPMEDEVRTEVGSLATFISYEAIAGNLAEVIEAVEGHVEDFDESVYLSGGGEAVLEPIGDGYCNIKVSHVDSDSIEVCGNGYKLFRTWTVLDWCTGASREQVQIIEKSDDEKPSLVSSPEDTVELSISPWTCEVDLSVVGELVSFDDNCDESIEKSVIVQGHLNSVGVGTYTAIVTGTDDCGNSRSVEVPIHVIDRVPPVPVCQDRVSATLAPDPNVQSGGVAKVTAEAFNAGSHDSGCGDVNVCVVRMEDVSEPIEDCRGVIGYRPVTCGAATKEVELYTQDSKGDCVPSGEMVMVTDDCSDYVKFCCEDVGSENMVRVIYSDDYGNENFCMVPVDVVDKSAASCSDSRVELTCTDDIDEKVTAPGANGSSCGASFVYSDSGKLDGCGTGSIYRNWYTDEDGNGEVSEGDIKRCVTEIAVSAAGGFDPHSIKWPKHYDDGTLSGVNLECDEDGEVTSEPKTIQMGSSFNCVPDADAIAPIWCEYSCGLIAYEHKDDTLSASDACLKILRRWTVIDWCLYEANGGENGDDDNDTARDEFEAVEDWAQGECSDCDADGKPVAEDNVYLRYKAVDKDGYYTYDQVIKVVDDTAPEITVSDTVYVDIVGGKTSPDDDTCYSEGSVSATAADFCGGQMHSADGLVWTIKRGDVEKRVVGGEATMSAGEGATGSDTVIEWTVRDGCGNAAKARTVVIFRDRKAPTPLCISSLTTAVMPISGSVAIWASDFDKGSFDNCTPTEDLVFALVRKGQELDLDAALAGELASREYRCEDLTASNADALDMYVIDGYGNYDKCTVSILIDDTQGVCDGENAGMARISGHISNELGSMVEAATVTIDANLAEYPRTYVTEQDGQYIFREALLTADYEISVEKSDSYNTGVSTADLVMIQKHLLGLRDLESPYRMIAADANSNGEISTLDIVLLRKLILGLSTELDAAPAWRFVDASQDLSVDPFSYNESIGIADLAGNMANQNFIAAKTGDVNNSANTLETRANGIVSLTTDQLEFEVGQRVEVPISGSNFAEVVGYQLTMNHSDLELVDVEAGAIAMGLDNIGQFEEALTMSWNNAAGVSTDEVLFTLVFNARTSGSLAESLSVTDEVTVSEAYAGEDLERKLVSLSVGTDSNVTTALHELHQNEPNPFAEQTKIGFVLPEAGRASLTVYDVTGQILLELVDDYGAGYNEVRIEKAQLQVNGILYYQLQSGEFTSTKKMVVVE